MHSCAESRSTGVVVGGERDEAAESRSAFTNMDYPHIRDAFLAAKPFSPPLPISTLPSLALTLLLISFALAFYTSTYVLTALYLAVGPSLTSAQPAESWTARQRGRTGGCRLCPARLRHRLHLLLRWRARMITSMGCVSLLSLRGAGESENACRNVQ